MLTGAKKKLSQWIKWGILRVLSPYFLLGTDTIENISLIESATAFSFKPSPKCLLEKIDVITGEEAEHNVLEVCILCYCSFWNKVTLNRDNFKDKGRSIVFIKTWLLKLKCLRLSNIKPIFCCILTFVCVICRKMDYRLHIHISPLERRQPRTQS